jgi:hypothetical protein
MVAAFKAGALFGAGVWAGILLISNSDDAYRQVARLHRYGKHLRAGYRP